MEYRINGEVYIRYAGAAEMLYTKMKIDIGRCGVSANETTLHPNNNS